jgi:hypothetical protein
VVRPRRFNTHARGSGDDDPAGRSTTCQHQHQHRAREYGSGGGLHALQHGEHESCCGIRGGSGCCGHRISAQDLARIVRLGATAHGGAERRSFAAKQPRLSASEPRCGRGAFSAPVPSPPGAGGAHLEGTGDRGESRVVARPEGPISAPRDRGDDDLVGRSTTCRCCRLGSAGRANPAVVPRVWAKEEAAERERERKRHEARGRQVERL